MKILGIETSCDETAAAVVENGDKLLSNVISSSIDLHKAYGGVVPEIAARSHIEAINPVINQALIEAKCNWNDIDGIAVTYGPGLGGSLLIGVLAAKTLASIKNIPLYPVNHVEAHVYAGFITEAYPSLSGNYDLQTTEPEFPLLALIVSGGHTQLALFRDHFDYELLGRTHDDAVGEAFDKVAKILGLPYPGGPSIEKAASKGDKAKFKLPKTKTKDKYGFSYSGLKTAVLRTTQKCCDKEYDFPSYKLADLLDIQQKSDIAASFQDVAIGQLTDKVALAYDEFEPRSIVVAGGVAANNNLRAALNKKLPIKPIYPDIKLCTDNAAMVAALGSFMYKENKNIKNIHSLDINPSLSM